MTKCLFACLLVVFCAGPLFAQNNNIGTPVPASAFGFTIFDILDHTVPVLPYSTCRSWDAQHVAWAHLEPSRGVFNWTNLDALMATCAGKDIIYTFGVVPLWAASDPTQHGPYPAFGKPTSCTLPNLDDWNEFVAAIVTHAAGRIKYWELWNEPMNHQYWSIGSVGPFNNSAAAFKQSAAMFSSAYRYLHQNVPGVQVLSPSTDKPFGEAWMTKYLAAGGDQNTFDILAVHGYPEKTVENIVPMISQYTALMAANHRRVPIWDTETAWGEDANDGGAFLTKMFLLSWSSGVSRTIWYGYDHDGVPLWTSTGLTAQGTAYKNLYSWLLGATLTSVCSKDSAGTYSCPISRRGYKGVITWNSTATVSSPVPKGLTQYRDLSGATHSISAGLVSIGNSPVLIETPLTKGLVGR